MLRVDICRDMDELINFWARFGLLSPISYKRCYAEFYATSRIDDVHLSVRSSVRLSVCLSVAKVQKNAWENPTYAHWRPAAAARRGFKMVLFTEPLKHLCWRYICALPSALLVVLYFD